MLSGRGQGGDQTVKNAKSSLWCSVPRGTLAILCEVSLIFMRGTIFRNLPRSSFLPWACFFLSYCFFSLIFAVSLGLLLCHEPRYSTDLVFPKGPRFWPCLFSLNDLQSKSCLSSQHLFAKRVRISLIRDGILASEMRFTIPVPLCGKLRLMQSRLLFLLP